MLKRTHFKPRQQNSRRADEWKRCDPYLGWLRKRPCFLSVHAPGRHICGGKVRACHFDPWGDKGVGTKVSDQAAFPMCDDAHAEQHLTGWDTFQANWGFDGRDVVTAYWSEWLEKTPMGVAWQRRLAA